MDTLDNETMEQIKNIVNDAKNNNTPLQKAKRTKKLKVVEDIPAPTPEPVIPAEVGPNVDALELTQPDIFFCHKMFVKVKGQHNRM